MSNEIHIERLSDPKGVAVVRMCADDRKNALTGDSARELRAALAELEADQGIAAVVITGGASFCAGAHRELLDAAGQGEPWAISDLQDVYGIFSDLRAMTVPTVAAVRGPAVGAGLNIALAADVRVVAANAYLRSMFVSNRIHPGGAHLHMLSRLGGVEAAVYLASLDNPVSGADFARMGLAALSVSDDEAETAAIRIARRAAVAPELARSIKSSIGFSRGMAVEDAARYEAAAQMLTLSARG